MEPKLVGIGRKIRKIRREKDILQSEVAKACGVSGGFISGIESGSRTPSLDTLRKIAAALGVTIAELFGEAPRPTKLEEAVKELMDKQYAATQAAEKQGA